MKSSPFTRLCFVFFECFSRYECMLLEHVQVHVQVCRELSIHSEPYPTTQTLSIKFCQHPPAPIFNPLNSPEAPYSTPPSHPTPTPAQIPTPVSICLLSKPNPNLRIPSLNPLSQNPKPQVQSRVRVCRELSPCLKIHSGLNPLS